jgi:hypothetical protein
VMSRDIEDRPDLSQGPVCSSFGVLLVRLEGGRWRGSGVGVDDQRADGFVGGMDHADVVAVDERDHAGSVEG